MKPKPTGLLKSLQDKRSKDDRPEGWKTFDELRAECPMPKTTARELLNQSVRDGLVEVKKLKSPIGGGQSAVRLNYREKP